MPRRLRSLSLRLIVLCVYCFDFFLAKLAGSDEMHNIYRSGPQKLNALTYPDTNPDTNRIHMPASTIHPWRNVVHDNRKS